MGHGYSWFAQPRAARWTVCATAGLGITPSRLPARPHIGKDLDACRVHERDLSQIELDRLRAAKRTLGGADRTAKGRSPVECRTARWCAAALVPQIWAARPPHVSPPARRLVTHG